MGKKGKAFLQPIQFRRHDHLAVISPNNSNVDEVIREFEDAEWSTGYRLWHLPVTESILNQVISALKKVAIVDSSAFDGFVFNKKVEEKPRRKRVKTQKPSEKQIQELNGFQKFQISNGYSDGTIKIYLCLLKVFLGWHKEKEDTDITNEDIRNFLAAYITENNFSDNYKRLMENAIRRYMSYKGLDEVVKNI